MIANKYVLRTRLGTGGMGVVFCADQPALARTVAIKLVHPALAADPAIGRRFHDEARAASRLAHPNVVAVMDYGETDDGTPFLVMEHVHGDTLTHILQREGPLALPRAAALVGQILAALVEAHAAGIVHGDMKSDNVLVERLHGGAELIKVVDFGLARITTEGAGIELGPDGRRVVSGTPEYMAPELLTGDGITPATDLYAVGAILYELVTGATPFAGGDPETILGRHVQEAVVPPSLRRPDHHVPPAMDRVIVRALAKEPSARYADAGAFAAALEAAALATDIAPTMSMPAPASASAAAIEATTRRWARRSSRRSSASEPDADELRETPAGTPARARERQARTQLAHAIGAGSVDAIALGYLALGRALVSAERLEAAIDELQEGVDLLTAGHGPTAPHAPRPLWQLLAALAALHDATGDRVAARRYALAAHQQAVACHSLIGRDRARALLDRLARAPRITGHPERRRASTPPRTAGPEGRDKPPGDAA
ncbi:MAG: serine/threonine protein kinase [Deltaproteobacteria bacterium]|nr:serine/threonine protein kinase [Deltaproteobacteria bacterium]